jgi:hypothetical protein
MDADRHAKPHLGAGKVDPADLAEGAAHPHGRPARHLDVVLAPEQQQQRVAAELDQAAAVRVRDRQQVGEARLDRLRDLLRPLLAVLGEALGQLGEPRDVDEHDRAVDRPATPVRPLGEVVQQQPRHVGEDGVGVGGGTGRRDAHGRTIRVRRRSGHPAPPRRAERRR